MTGVCLLMSTGSLGGTVKEREAVGWRCMLGTVMIALSTSVVKTGYSVFALELGEGQQGRCCSRSLL